MKSLTVKQNETCFHITLLGHLGEPLSAIEIPIEGLLVLRSILGHMEFNRGILLERQVIYPRDSDAP